jgi:NAD+ kinase
LGKLGFLTEIEIPDLFDGLEKLISGQYKIDERMMLSTQLVREGRVIEHFNSLNDTVITKGVLARMITVSVYVDERYVDTYSADGIILSTPTGSTAYSLSAGGPIVYPKVEVILLTPICPHTLYARSLVLPESGIIRLVINGDHNETMLTIDGQYGYNLMPGDEIIVKKSEYVTKLIRLSGRNFFDVLQQKLKGG